MRETRQPPEDDNGRSREKSATSRRVQTKITEMHQRRAAFIRTLQTGEPDTRATLEFQTAVLELSETLRPFRGRAEHHWSTAGPDGYERMLDRLPELTRAKPVTEVETVGFGRTKRVTREQPQTLPVMHLLDLSHDLDDIAREMGFEVEPEQATDRLHGGDL
jgi:hypothetical protein